MHPALMIAVMEERDRELARRNKHAWKRPAPQASRRRTTRSGGRSRGRLSAVLARGQALFE
jgi:hypothetical protein